MQPSIYQYLDYRQYLRDLLNYKRENSNAFSLEQLGRKTGCLTKSHISLIVAGKRTLTTRRAAALGRALGISEKEMPFYHKLIQFNQAKDHVEKEHCLKELMSQVGRSHDATMSMKSYQVLEQWHCLAIRELARMPNFDQNPNSIASRLKNLLSPAEAKRALKLLDSAGMLKLTDDGKVVVSDEIIRSTDEVNSLAIRRYHSSCLDLGRRIIETEPIENREFGSVNVLLKPEDIPKLKELLKNLREKVLELATAEPTPECRVTQVNVQMFQLS